MSFDIRRLHDNVIIRNFFESIDTKNVYAINHIFGLVRNSEGGSLDYAIEVWCFGLALHKR